MFKQKQIESLKMEELNVYEISSSEAVGGTLRME